MRYRLQRHDGTDCSATMVPITVLRMVPIQRYRHLLYTITYICDALDKYPNKLMGSMKKTLSQINLPPS